MNINQNYNYNNAYKGVNISKGTKTLMDARGELDEFNKFLPDLERKGKKSKYNGICKTYLQS